eukprot:CAMPEP_0119124684 /NCGR_PEP_ID=MMETSP1310-20130426/4235_1 /TAXON_ID=464262 /ORGANISM="Genus nov. species nov., Strain RCC2339" /LENGTH=283 /DNA_ID=CAMNT_0007114675 /DNA_START=182 /DNA_END=1033 /DNA_ORIENTATION=-
MPMTPLYHSSRMSSPGGGTVVRDSTKDFQWETDPNSFAIQYSVAEIFGEEAALLSLKLAGDPVIQEAILNNDATKDLIEALHGHLNELDVEDGPAESLEFSPVSEADVVASSPRGSPSPRRRRRDSSRRSPSPSPHSSPVAAAQAMDEAMEEAMEGSIPRLGLSEAEDGESPRQARPAVAALSPEVIREQQRLAEEAAHIVCTNCNRPLEAVTAGGAAGNAGCAPPVAPLSARTAAGGNASMELVLPIVALIIVTYIVLRGRRLQSVLNFARSSFAALKKMFV